MKESVIQETEMDAVNHRLSFFSRLGRWTAELVLVFVGVYAAFWLNNYQQHRQDLKRRDQILATLEQLLEEGIEGAKGDRVKAEHQAAEFDRALASGEIPPLHSFAFTSDYNPGDIATLLQSGGIELLQLKTLTTLRELESVIRWGLSNMSHYQKLSDELIVPNLDQDISCFYDPATKKLRSRFQMYPEALRAEVKFFQDLEKAEVVLLQQIQAERK